MKIKNKILSGNYKVLIFVAVFSIIGVVGVVVTLAANSNTSDTLENFEGSIVGKYVTHGKAKFSHTNNSNEAYKGKRALKIESNDSGLTRWLVPITSIPVVTGQEINSSVFIKTENVIDNARFAISYFGDKGSKEWSDAWIETDLSNQRLKGTNGWTEFKISGKVPKNAKYARPEFRLKDKGTIWIDLYKFQIMINQNNIENQPAPKPDNNLPQNEHSPEDPEQSTSTGSSETDESSSTKPGQFPKTSIPYEGPNQYNWKLIPEDNIVSVGDSGTNRANGTKYGPSQNLFTVDCKTSHFANDDPIVFPNKPGASHNHEFFGAADVNANSTIESIVSAENTCTVGADRSAYWTPTAYQDGKKIIADSNKFYYKAGGLNPATTKFQQMPFGLKMIAGNANAKSPKETIAQAGYWYKTPVYKNSPKITHPKLTQTSRGGSSTIFPVEVGKERLQVLIFFPQCWDGENLWLPNTTHMTYAVNGKCPDTHPVPLMQLQYNLGYNAAKGGSGFKLSSGDWYTFHADFVNGWHPETLKKLTEACTFAGRYCGIAVSERQCNRSPSARGCIEISKDKSEPSFFGAPSESAAQPFLDLENR
jgi:hypothetical protein